jgi:hypothetical protein
VSHPSVGGMATPDCPPQARATSIGDLIGKALSAAHLRRIDSGLEVLDPSGARVAMLQRTASP